MGWRSQSFVVFSQNPETTAALYLDFSCKHRVVGFVYHGAPFDYFLNSEINAAELCKYLLENPETTDALYLDFAYKGSQFAYPS